MNTVTFTLWVKDVFSILNRKGLPISLHLLRSEVFGIVTIAENLTPCSYSKLGNCRF